MSVFTDVLRFMKIGHSEKLRAEPGVPSEATAKLCWNLIDEEVNKELKQAAEEGDVVGVADALADSIWVLICMAQCYGIPIAEVWEEVARTNMAKFPDGKVIRRPEDGKILKPPGWKPPDIALIINEAKTCSICCIRRRVGNSSICAAPQCVAEQEDRK